MRIETGECIYCGQIQQFEIEDGIHLSAEERNRKATELCDCPEARGVQDSVEVKTKTQENIRKLFHDDQPEMEKLLADNIEYIQDGVFTEVVAKTVSVKGRISITSKGKIKVEREQKKKTTLENQ